MNAHIAQLHYLTLESYIYKSPLHVLPNPLEESGPAHSNFIFEFFEAHIQCTQVEMAKRQHFLFWFWGYNNWRGSDEVACNLGQIHRKRKHPSVGRPHHLNLKLNPINGCAVVKDTHERSSITGPCDGLSSLYVEFYIPSNLDFSTPQGFLGNLTTQNIRLHTHTHNDIDLPIIHEVPVLTKRNRAPTDGLHVCTKYNAWFLVGVWVNSFLAF